MLAELMIKKGLRMEEENAEKGAVRDCMGYYPFVYWVLDQSGRICQ